MDHIEYVFVADIIANPADDTPRLIYADWLEECGARSGRAHFIREHIRLSSLRCRPSMAHNMKTCPKCTGIDAIMDTLQADWLGGLRGKYEWMPGCSRITFDEADTEITFERGFVSQVKCTQAIWLGSGNNIAPFHPLTRVELSDRWALKLDEEKYGWWDVTDITVEGPEDIARELWVCLDVEELWVCLDVEELWVCLDVEREQDYSWKLYPTDGAATDALSRACIQWGRKIILPQLTANSREVSA